MRIEPTLGEHIERMVGVFDLVRRALKPEGTCWVNYGDCYATTVNGRSAAATKAAGTDDRTFRDKPFSTVGPVFCPDHEKSDRRGNGKQSTGKGMENNRGRIIAGGYLKPKDLCLIPHRFAIAMQEAGWWVRSDITWGKPNAMPDSSGRYRPSVAAERIFLFTKSARSHYDAEAVRMPPAEASLARWNQDIQAQVGSTRANAGAKTNGPMKAVGGPHRRDKQRGHSRRHAGFNDRWGQMTKAEQQANGRLLRNWEPDLSPLVPQEVWEIATAAYSEAHFATFPPELVTPCILAGCPESGTVLDPFGGSGTTGLVADRLRRNAILIELNPEYIDIARKRIEGDAPLFTEINIT